MQPVCLDHIVVVAPTLKSGVQWVRDALGVTAELGGRHMRIGTHNCVLKLGPTCYLEVIAIDPNAPTPAHPRWFGLDDLASTAAPRLAAWVARSDDIQETVSQATEELGTVRPMSRTGHDWLITVPEDGSLPLGGAAPLLIQWHAPDHPAGRMRDVGCRLVTFDLCHPEPDRIGRLLDKIGFNDNRVRVARADAQSAPRLVALIETPAGNRTL
jgi:hypothetical protein